MAQWIDTGIPKMGMCDEYERECIRAKSESKHEIVHAVQEL